MVMTIVPASALRDPARADTRCGCIAAVNAMPEMVESNTVIAINLFGPPRALVLTCKRSDRKRGKPSLLAASYCPFCGVKYETRAPTADLPTADCRLP